MRNTQPAGRLQTFSALSLTALLATAGIFVLPLVSQNVDAAPVLANEWYLDLDCNGHVDAVTFQFNAAITDASIRPSDWTMTQGKGSGTVVVPANGFSTGPPTWASTAGAPCPDAAGSFIPVANRPSLANIGSDAIFTLYFPEGINPDTGAMTDGATTYTAPVLGYTSDAAAPAKGPSGNLASLGACAAPCRIDGSTAVLKAAYAKTGDNFMIVTFSENVGKLTGSTWSAPTHVDNAFCNFVGAAVNTTVPITGVGTVPTRGYRVTFTAPLGNLITSPVSFSVGGACPGVIVDTAGNVVPSRTVTLGSPYVSRIYASAGDPNLVIEFNGPVDAGGGADITQFQTTFEMITGAGSGLTGIQSTGFHTRGSDRLLLTAQGSPPNLCDVLQTAPACAAPNTGTHVRVNAAKVFGFKANGISETSTGTNLAGCPSNPLDPAPQDFCLSDTGSAANPTIATVSAPRVLSFTTLDTDSNGCLDAIRVLWNENMHETFPATGWRVLFANEAAPSLATGHSSFEPTTGVGSANDAITYVVFPETCTVPTPFATGNTGHLPRVSYCDGVDVVRVGEPCMTTFTKDLSAVGNQMIAGTNAALRSYIYRAPTLDGAKPVIMFAATVDTAPNDGYIDGMRVMFSEGIDATSLEAAQWTATIPTWTNAARCPLPVGTTYTVTGVTTTTPFDANPQLTPALPTLGTRSGEVLVTFSPKAGLNPVGDTGCIPDLTYTGSPKFVTEAGLNPGGLRMNNVVAGPTPAAGAANCAIYGELGGDGPFINNQLCENDGAPPVMIPSLVQGTLGSDTAYVTFSEPVFGSGATAPAATCGTPAAFPAATPGPTWFNGQVRAVDFDYQDKNSAGATGVSSVTSVSSDCRKWQLTLNVPAGGGLTASDQTSGDCLQSRIPTVPAAEGIRDAVPAAPMITPASTPTGIGNVAYPLNGATVPCVTFGVGPSPVAGSVTIDSDHDGSLDAIKVTFTSSVKDVITAAVPPNAFAVVGANDADKGAAVTGYSGGYTLCRVEVATAGISPEDPFYADLTGACVGTVAAGDFRYSAFPGPLAGHKPAGTPVVAGDLDIGVATLVVDATLRRVAGPGGNTAPSISDMLYSDVGGATATSIEAGDLRLSGFDSRFWSVTFPGGPAIVTGVTTGLPSTAVATHATTAGTAPTGAACHDSAELSPNVGNDNILFICFEEQRDAFGNLIPNTGALPTFTYSGSTVLDSTGAVIGVISTTTPADGAQPVLVSALAGAGTKTITATMSEPVTQPGATTLLVSDFVFQNGNAGGGNCPSGAASLSKIVSGAIAPAGTGAHVIVFETDGLLSTDDIGAPFLVFVPDPHAGCTNFDSIRAISTQVVQKAPTNLVTWPAAVRFADRLAPTIASAGFVDANGDGVVDAVQVKFNELVNDGDLDALDWSVKVGAQAMTILFVTSGQNGAGSCQNTYSLTAGTGAVFAALQLFPNEVTPLTPYGVGTFDDTVFLCLDPDSTAANAGTKDLGTGITTGKLLYTAVPTTTRIADSFCDAIGGACTTANLLQDLATNAPITIADMARPVVLNNCRAGSFLDVDGGGTQDTTPPLSEPTCPTNVLDDSPETADLDNDGKIDAVRIKFSESMADASYNQGEWSIGRTITGMDTGTGSLAANDNTIWIKFAEGSQPDGATGRATSPLLPDVGYFPGGTMKDAAGNLLRGVSTGACVAAQLPGAAPTGCTDERDGASPTAVTISAVVNTNVVTIQFSEAVGTGATGTGAITSADLAYVNSPASTGATSITGISHTVGSNTVTLTLNANLKPDDIAAGADKISFTPGNIREASCAARPALPALYTYPLTTYTLPGGPNPPPGSCYRELALNSIQVGLSGVNSHAPPATIVLDFDPAATTPTSVKLEWTAPATFGGSTIATYEVWRMAGPFVPLSHVGATRVDLSTLTPPVSLTAGAKSATIPGLTTGTEYSFVIRAIDSDGNIGTDSNTVTTTPEAPDTDKPCKVTDLGAESVDETFVTLTWIAPDADCLASSGTVTGYKVSLQREPGQITDAASFSVGVTTTGLAFLPSSFAAPGVQQRVKVSGLITGETYQFAIAAIDAAGEAPFSNVLTATLEKDGTAEPGPIIGLVASNPTDTSVTLTWTASGADSVTGTVSGYEIHRATTVGSPGLPVSSSNLAFSPSTSAFAAPGEEQSVVVSQLTPGTTYFFTVAGKSGTDVGATSTPVSITTTGGLLPITQGQLDAALAEFATTLKVTHSGDTNTLTWDTPPTAGGRPAIGVQVWKLVDGVYGPPITLSALSDEFLANSYSDVGSAADSYKVTAFYGNNKASGFASTSSDINNFDSLAAATGSNTILGLDPVLFWILVGVLALLLILVVVLLVVRSRKVHANDVGDEDEDGGFADADEPAPEATEAAAAEAATPTAAPDEWAQAAPEVAAPAAVVAQTAQGTPDKHYLSCPKCATEFAAVGIKPLAIQCPNCGVRGTLR